MFTRCLWFSTSGLLLLRLNTSPGNPQIQTSIPVGNPQVKWPTDLDFCKVQVIADPGTSIRSGKYLSWVPAKSINNFAYLGQANHMESVILRQARSGSGGSEWQISHLHTRRQPTLCRSPIFNSKLVSGSKINKLSFSLSLTNQAEAKSNPLALVIPHPQHLKLFCLPHQNWSDTTSI
jgi:hypothetical protein